MPDIIMSNMADIANVLIEEPELFEITGVTATATVGTPTKFTTKIAGESVTYRWTLQSARLTQLSQQILQNSRGPYNLVTGACSAVVADLEVQIEEDTWITIQEWLRNIINHDVPSESKKVDLPAFQALMEMMNLNWGTKSMALFFQHFGASNSKMTRFFDDFEARGAADGKNTIREDRRNDFERVLHHSPGLPVSSIEIGQVDRDYTQNKLGFQDLLQAQYENMLRIISLKKRAQVQTQMLEEEKAKEGSQLDPEDVAEIDSEIANLRRQSRNWTNLWGGARQEVNIDEDGTVETVDRWHSDNIPCGRIGLSIPKQVPLLDDEGNVKLGAGGNVLMVPSYVAATEEDGSVVMKDGEIVQVPEVEEVTYDFWKARGDDGDNPEAPSRRRVVDTTAKATSSSSDDEDDEEPF